MDSRDCLAQYPFVVVRIACRVCSRRGSYRLARLAAKFGPEVSLRDLTDRFSYDCMWRAEAHGRRGKSGCGVYLPDLEQPRPPDVPGGGVAAAGQESPPAKLAGTRPTSMWTTARHNGGSETGRRLLCSQCGARCAAPARATATSFCGWRPKASRVSAQRPRENVPAKSAATISIVTPYRGASRNRVLAGAR
jgi:hypothetical protein